MQAAIVNELPGSPQIDTVDVSKPADYEVLVRTVAASVCGSDIHVIDGRVGARTPLILGHEATGVVADVGAAVTGVRPGDRVLVGQSSSCGWCYFCQRGRPTLCRAPGLRDRLDGTARVHRRDAPVHLGSGIGAFAELMLVHERSVVRLPEDVDLVPAAMLGCAVTTGMGAVLRTARVPAGATVAVVGAGGIGLSCVQGARLAGAARIIAIDTNAERLALARTFGATDTVTAGTAEADSDLAGTVEDMTGGGVEYSFEAVGTPATVQSAFAMLREGGTCTVIGMVPKSAPITLKASKLLAERRIQGSANGSTRLHLDVPRYLEFYRQGRLRLDELVGLRVPLRRIGDAVDSMRNGRHTRAVVSVGEE
jgi:S-(hydroxymethyl)glutathione dehydrogenase / alcohol dehydrogenase